MICRMWRGWTQPPNATSYESYLKGDLFPRVKQELGGRGYRGFHLLRRDRGDEVEFVTMLWFDSLEAVRGFAGTTTRFPSFPKRRIDCSRATPNAANTSASAASSGLLYETIRKPR